MIMLVLTGIVHSAAAQPIGLDSGHITKTLKLPDGATFTVTVSVAKWRGDPYKNAQLWGARGGDTDDCHFSGCSIAEQRITSTLRAILVLLGSRRSTYGGTSAQRQQC